MEKKIINKKNAPCFYCGGKNLVKGVPVGQNAEVGRIGLKHKTMKVFVGVEELFADLCVDCGTAVRFYVEDKNRNWLTKK